MTRTLERNRPALTSMEILYEARKDGAEPGQTPGDKSKHVHLNQLTKCSNL